MLGGGLYDDLCTQARESAQAEGVLIIVIRGDRGSGFSAQLSGRLMVSVPTILRQMADEIEADAQRAADTN